MNANCLTIDDPFLLNKNNSQGVILLLSLQNDVLDHNITLSCDPERKSESLIYLPNYLSIYLSIRTNINVIYIYIYIYITYIIMKCAQCALPVITICIYCIFIYNVYMYNIYVYM